MTLLLLALAGMQLPSLPTSPDPMPPRQPTQAQERAEPPRASADPAIETRYRACVDRIRADAEGAVADANAWRAEGGGLHARQCLGLALSALERWGPAATAFEQAAGEAEAASDPRRADFLVQAGNAWVAAGEPARAVQAFDLVLRAEGLADALRGAAHLDRARALVALGDREGARADLDRALALMSGDPFAWYLSAALARQQSDPVRAGSDIARARALAPDDPDILLLAGTIAGQAGDMSEAERLYRRVIELAPESEAGRAASASLATVTEVEIDAPADPPPPPAEPQRR